MNTMKLWDEFEKTGKIEDYLRYSTNKLQEQVLKSDKDYTEELTEEIAVHLNED